MKKVQFILAVLLTAVLLIAYVDTSDNRDEIISHTLNQKIDVDAIYDV